MASLPKKLLFIFLIFLLLFLSRIPKAIYAVVSQGRDISSYGIEEYNKDARARIDAAEKGETIIEGSGTTAFQIRTMIADLIRLTGGCVGETDSKYCKPEQSAMGNVTSLIATLYAHPPASGLAYTADLLANAGLLAKPAYAQGIGFSALTPFLPFWKVTRNVAYAALILMMIAIGFMIIFRMKIDPKTIISIQAALPKIVLTLILITFSYPIVGFIIDLMYLTMAIVISLMVSGMGGSLAGADTANLQSTYMTAGAGDLLGAIFWPVLAFLKSFAGELIGTGVASGIIYTLGSNAVLSLPFFGTFGWPALLALALPALILGLILVLGLLFTFIRLLLLLLNSYIQVVISLILGPIYLLGETIPGRAVFTGWLMNIIANLVVFPATAVIIMFSVWLTAQGQTDAPKWSPPFIGFAAPGGNFHALLGLGVMFIAPTLVAQIKKAFGPRPIMPITPATIIAPITGSFQTGLGAASQFYYAQSAMSMIPGLKNLVPGGPHKSR